MTRLLDGKDSPTDWVGADALARPRSAFPQELVTVGPDQGEAA